MQTTDSGDGQILVGSDANLDPMRQIIQSESDNNLWQSALNLTENDVVLMQPQCVSRFKDEEKVDEGYAIVTNERFIYVSKNSSEYDVVMDAICIQLHAVSSEGSEASVYIQAMEKEEMVEISLAPKEKEQCQELFEALSKLVSLHPIQEEGQADEEEWMTGNDEMIVAAPPAADVVPTEEERQTMLDRLDNLLVVPPEYELNGDQFDDADEDDQGQFDDADDDELL